MEIHLTAEYVPWANGENGEVSIRVNGTRAFGLPVNFDAGPKEPQIEQAVREWLSEVARRNGALPW